MVPVISLKILKKLLKPDVKVDSIAEGILKMTRSAHLKLARKGDKTVTAEAVNLVTPDFIVSLLYCQKSYFGPAGSQLLFTGMEIPT
ncbi:hypothetical protein QF003_004274 [Leclercia adecarboxylata]